MQKSRMKENRVSYANLIKLIARSSGYATYEVEDVVLHTAKVIRELLADGKSTKINHLGTFYTKDPTTKKLMHVHTREEINAIIAPVVMFATEPSLKEHMKETYEKQRAAESASPEPTIEKLAVSDPQW